MDQRATGSFEVDARPQASAGGEGDAALGRWSLEKKSSGDLVGTGSGEMPTAATATKGSAGYVAIERVTGRRHGHRGSFVFRHSGTPNRGTQQLSITVVPGSGTGELAAIAGTSKRNIVDGQHRCEVDDSPPK